MKLNLSHRPSAHCENGATSALLRYHGIDLSEPMIFGLAYGPVQVRLSEALCVLPFLFPETTMIGAMAHYVSHGDKTLFQPMNANFGVMPPLGFRVKGGKRARNAAMSQRALEEIGIVTETLFCV